MRMVNPPLLTIFRHVINRMGQIGGLNGQREGTRRGTSAKVGDREPGTEARIPKDPGSRFPAPDIR